MRKTGPPSEVGRLLSPIARLLDAAWHRMHWWVIAMIVLYAVSGTTVVKSDEVAVVLRWGRLVGDTPALQEHGSGLLFSFPRPIDRVVRVPVKRVYEVAISTLSGRAEAEEYAADTLNPVTQGYALTGDHNIVEADVVVRYRIRDAAQWAFYGPTPDDVLRVEVTTAMVRSLGEMAVDRVLSDGRKDLIAMATRRAQAGLDACHSGLEVSSMELTRLAPPPSLIPEFDAVQSAYIGAETRRKEAQAFAATAIPQAQSAADTMLQSARGSAESDLSAARGAADAFRALDREYRANAVVVRERLYRDGVEIALRSAGRVRWIPAPVGGRYNNFRVSIPSGGQTTPVIVEDEDEK